MVEAKVEALVAAIRTIAPENMTAIAVQNSPQNMSYTEAVQRLQSLLRLNQNEPKPGSGQENNAGGAPTSGSDGVAGTTPPGPNGRAGPR